MEDKYKELRTRNKKKVNIRLCDHPKQWNKTLENTKPQNTAAAMSKWASNDCPQRTKQQCTSKPPLGHYKTTIAASWSKMGLIFFWKSIHIFSNEIKTDFKQNVKESSAWKTPQILVSAGCQDSRFWNLFLCLIHFFNSFYALVMWKHMCIFKQC